MIVQLGGRRFEQAELACPDCGAPMVLYWRVRARPPFYGCTAFETTGCASAHGATWSGKPLGTPADYATRRARKHAHRLFDQLWLFGRMSRTAAYRWLAARLGLSRDAAHISRLNYAQCLQLIAACRRLEASGIIIDDE